MTSPFSPRLPWRGHRPARTGDGRAAAVALLCTAGVLWGFGGVLGSALAERSGLVPSLVAAGRLGLGGLFLLTYLAVTGVSFPRGRTAWARIGVLALLSAVFQSCYFASIAIGSVSAATLVTIGSVPVSLVLLDAIRARARPTLPELRATLVGVAGLALVVAGSTDPSTATGPAVDGEASGLHGAAAHLLALASGLSFASTAAVSRRPVAGLDERSGIAYGFVAAGGILLLGSAPWAPSAVTLDGRALALLVAFALLPTALAYGMYFRGLPRASTAMAGVTTLLEPLTATVLAVVLLGDRPSWLSWAGTALLLLSVVDAARHGATTGPEGDVRPAAPVPRP